MIGVCSCRTRQLEPQRSKQEAEDWCRKHLDQVRLALVDPAKKLDDKAYLAYLQECATDTRRSVGEREQWRALAEEAERRLGRMKKRPYDTGVETAALFDL